MDALLQDAGYDPMAQTSEILKLSTTGLTAAEEALVQAAVASQQSRVNFCSWLLSEPQLPDNTGYERDAKKAEAHAKQQEELQSKLDNLAASVEYKIDDQKSEGGPEDIRLKRAEWRAFARREAEVDARSFNELWTIFDDVRKGRNRARKPTTGSARTEKVVLPWQYEAATTNGRGLLKGLANDRRFRARKAKLDRQQRMLG